MINEPLISVNQFLYQQCRSWNFSINIKKIEHNLIGNNHRIALLLLCFIKLLLQELHAGVKVANVVIGAHCLLRHITAGSIFSISRFCGLLKIKIRTNPLVVEINCLVADALQGASAEPKEDWNTEFGKRLSAKIELYQKIGILKKSRIKTSKNKTTKIGTALFQETQLFQRVNSLISLLPGMDIQGFAFTLQKKLQGAVNLSLHKFIIAHRKQKTTSRCL